MKSRMMILEMCGLFLLCMNLQGQYRYDPSAQNFGCSLTGNIQYDLSMKYNDAGRGDSSAAARPVVYKRLYSPVRAGFFSLVVPGAGQFYTKNYWQSAAFFGAEVLMWVMYASYEKKGNDQTNVFQNYADANWSVVKYAGWINANFGQAIGQTIPIDPNQNLLSWQRVSWNDLNAAEDAIGLNANIGESGFSHRLALHGDQQYYEMIGKYAQFGGGWSDAGGYTRQDVLGNNGIGNVTPQFLAYSKMRGDANSSYTIATTVSYIIIANHVLSALEAAWNASRLNHRIKLEGHIESRRIRGNLAEFVPTLHVQYEL